ncbi:hypothetical protein CUR178_00413 [Leishmania enriettii]|uniref:Uncharacterized protein n=1 Tax=Leishmania enriettii TaxID=5663 RepID=A0A836GV99_LEIEN|nr:hypothetical protein CUR178_00413 [Leishmania enriettii]
MGPIRRSIEVFRSKTRQRRTSRCTIAISQSRSHPRPTSSDYRDSVSLHLRAGCSPPPALSSPYSFEAVLRIFGNGGRCMAVRNYAVRGVAKAWMAPQGVSQAVERAAESRSEFVPHPSPTVPPALTASSTPTAGTVRASMHR